ncbi:MAG: hypothetical protein AAFU41_16900 [Pseudomonadota bacterium]
MTTPEASNTLKETQAILAQATPAQIRRLLSDVLQSPSKGTRLQ